MLPWHHLPPSLLEGLTPKTRPFQNPHCHLSFVIFQIYSQWPHLTETLVEFHGLEQEEHAIGKWGSLVDMLEMGVWNLLLGELGLISEEIVEIRKGCSINGR